MHYRSVSVPVEQGEPIKLEPQVIKGFSACQTGEDTLAVLYEKSVIYMTCTESSSIRFMLDKQCYLASLPSTNQGFAHFSLW